MTSSLEGGGGGAAAAAAAVGTLGTGLPPSPAAGALQHTPGSPKGIPPGSPRARIINNNNNNNASSTSSGASSSSSSSKKTSSVAKSIFMTIANVALLCVAAYAGFHATKSYVSEHIVAKVLGTVASVFALDKAVSFFGLGLKA